MVVAVTADLPQAVHERHRWGRLDMPGSRRAVLTHVLEGVGRPAPALGEHTDEILAELDRVGACGRLSDRLANAEQAIGPEPGEEPPPPHW